MLSGRGLGGSRVMQVYRLFHTHTHSPQLNNCSLQISSSLNNFLQELRPPLLPQRDRALLLLRFKRRILRAIRNELVIANVDLL